MARLAIGVKLTIRELKALPLLMLILVMGAFLFMGQQRAMAKESAISVFEFNRVNSAAWIFRGQGKAEPDENFRLSQTPDGTPALELIVGKDAPEYLQRSITAENRELPVQAGYYRLHFRMRTDLRSGFAYPRIMAQQADGRQVDLVAPETTAGLRISGQTPWREYWVAFQMPAALTAASLTLRVDNGIGTAAFASLQLEALTEEEGHKLLVEGSELKAPNDTGKLFYRDDMDSDKGEWIKDGVSPYWFENGKMIVDCLSGKTTGMFTLWLNRPLSGDFYIAYDTMCMEPEAWNNLNFFLLGRTLENELPAPGRFDSSYGQYHREAKTYIGTLTYKWSRMRKDPGFNLISEDQNMVGHVNRKYFFEIIKKGKVIEWRIDGRTAHRIEDPEMYESGLFALRSADTKFWVDNFQIYTYPTHD